MAIDLHPSAYYELEAIASRAGATVECVEHAAMRHNVPVSLLFATLVIENGRPGTESLNTNGTIDYGPAQINTIWLPRIKQEFNFGVKDIRDDGCKAVKVASWITSTNLDAAPDLWTGIGRYHSATDSRNFSYRLLVYKALRHIGVSNQNYDFPK